MRHSALAAGHLVAGMRGNSGDRGDRRWSPEVAWARWEPWSRWPVVAVAGVLFAGIYARRDFDSSPGDAVLVLFVVPIALWAIADVFDA
jgi:hypothetical protein